MFKKVATTAFSALLVLPSACLATELFIYTAPTGERVVTDRPINLAGYELEESKISAGKAGTALRYQDNDKNRQLIDRHIRNAAYLYDMDSALIKAVIKQESAFNIRARSNKGATGLMQLMPATAARYKVKDLYDPKQNIYAGTQHLRYLLYQYDDLKLALAAYNAGEGAVARFGGVPPYPETINYVAKVMGWYQAYRN
ncbi:lytic transglycosylase domain-containing protein [Reinekea marinisedimentorum]|uniref:Soluble lytic murein transglycosylase-like protein n=1 Tax=Reinekea marinisedimentorum TaxID=230495 RepID=A0A4R3IB40_9GAMM|nr:lytic transglycosylase domain-containing protein [Reinekea marinisedimentorum]TCS42471.1 soluble lytic murein transglycosylase-like protein [Reinekea marinisedimentorum]